MLYICPANRKGNYNFCCYSDRVPRALLQKEMQSDVKKAPTCGKSISQVAGKVTHWSTGK